VGRIRRFSGAESLFAREHDGGVVGLTEGLGGVGDLARGPRADGAGAVEAEELAERVTGLRDAVGNSVSRSPGARWSVVSAYLASGVGPSGRPESSGTSSLLL
jgi:hypothetical protein